MPSTVRMKHVKTGVEVTCKKSTAANLGADWKPAGTGDTPAKATKQDLLARAAELGIEVKKSASNQAIADAIAEAEAALAEGDDESNDDE